MIFILLKAVLRRLFELFFTSAAFSAVLTVLSTEKILDGNIRFLPIVYIFAALFMIANFIMLRNCYCDFRDNRLFRFVNFLAYLVFLAVSFSIFLYSSKAYTWLFAITKFLRYTDTSITVAASAAVFHSVGIAEVFLAPTGLGWVLECDDE